jgi:chromosome segregation ATPase
MSINVKKYTKDQMAKMVEDAQEKTAALEAEIIELKNCIDEKNDLIAEYANLKAEMQRKNAALTEQISQMNGEAINKANEIANLKADFYSAKNSAQYLNDQGQQYWRAWQASNEIANLKADLDSAKNSAQCLNDQGQQYWRAWQASKREVADLKNKLNDTEAALGRANACIATMQVEKDQQTKEIFEWQGSAQALHDDLLDARERANYAESHPWRNLWAWIRRKLKMA